MKTIKLSAILVYLLFFWFPKEAIAQWHPVAPASDILLRSVHFPSPQVGYATGYELGSWQGTVLKTIDAGTTWSATPTGDAMSVQFLNNSKGFMGTTFGFVLKSENGGTTWDTLTSANGGGVGGAMFFVNDTLGFFGGWYLGFISRTTNGGQTWASANSENLNAIHFPTPTTGFAAGDVIKKTTDAGLTWTNVYPGPGIRDIHFTSATTGFAVGFNNLLLKTTDGGATWHQKGIPGINTEWVAVHFPSAAVGYVTGGSGLILKTTDAGDSWRIQASGTTQALLDVFCTDNNTCFAVGDSGTVLRTTNGGSVTGIRKEVSYAQQQISFYPNPGSGLVFVEMPEELANPGNELVLQNLLGQEIKRYYLPGEKSHKIELKGLSPGVYLYQIINNKVRLQHGRYVHKQGS